MRARCEERLRELFVAAGGKPERATPHYLVLGRAAWFEGLSSEMRSVTLPLSAFPDDATSVTYPDGLTAMVTSAESGFPHEPRPYLGRVHRLAGLGRLVREHGLPADVWDPDYATFAARPFGRFVEV